MSNREIKLSNPQIKGMLQLLSVALNQKETASIIDVSLWQEIKEELEAHAILPLVSDLVMNADIPNKDKIEIAKSTAINVRAFHKLMTAQTAVINLLNSNNISVAVIKGASVAQYYTRPELRQYGDIDILVLPKDYKKAFDLLCASGYKTMQENDDLEGRHIEFITPEEIEIELHRYFSSSSNEEQNTLLDGWLYDSLKDIKSVKLNKYNIPVFSALENGLIILGHINQHLSRGLGLRQIIDWMFYVRSELTDVFWKESFQGRAEAIGIDYLAKTITKMCQKYLGLSLEFTWCQDADDKLVDDLMLYIIKRGNFGEKQDEDCRKIYLVTHNFTNPIKAFRYITERGCAHMKEKGLKPRKAYAWLYQIGRMIHLTFSRKSKKSLTKEIQNGMQEADLLKRLKVTKL